MARQRQRITLKTFTEAVTAWLKAERATVEEAMALDFALHAGLIEGTIYQGTREFNDAVTEEGITDSDWGEGNEEQDFDEALESRDSGCGCLLDTLEREGGRGRVAIRGNVLTAFVGATHIGYGHTPANNSWAKAAHKGIEQYLAQKGA